jgi:hypothetical protein
MGDGHVISNFVETVVVANEQEVIDPTDIPSVPWKLLYQRCDKNIRAISSLIDGFEVTLNIATTQPIQAIAVVAMPGTKVFDVRVFPFSFAE